MRQKTTTTKGERMMTQEQFDRRRAENEHLIISLNEEGNFRVYSPAYPSKSYTVSGSER
jgi:hypothetical protein